MIDTVVLELSMVFMTRLSWLIPNLFDSLIDALTLYKARSNKPFITILIPAHAESETIEARKILVQRDIPSFPSFERGAKALKKIVEYYRHQNL